MRFMLMMHAPRATGDWQAINWTPEEIKAHIGFMMALNGELQASGELVDAQGLAMPGEARVVFVPSAGEHALVVGRDGPLGQVFRNLIDNARSFSPPDGEVRITLARDEMDPDRPVRVRLEDQGPGIPDENLETVFERFYTSRPRGTAFGANSGLGLSIVRQIVEAHGGRVWAENRKDADGARFEVALPSAPVRRP